MGPNLCVRLWRCSAGALLLLCLLATSVSAHAGHTPDSGQSGSHFPAELRAAIDKARPVVERYGYAGVAGAVSAEGMGIPLPGQTTLMAAALAAARGELDIVMLAVMAFLAAVGGNSVGYLIGRIGGLRILRKTGISAAREAKIIALFQRFGGGFIVMARFLDGPRQLNGLVAGMLEMPWWAFTLFNALGALLWVGIWGLGTFFLWEHVGTVHVLLGYLNPWVAGLVTMAVLAALLYLWRSRSVRQTS
jgi:membrane protein DedA with SNARE-associated domain